MKFSVASVVLAHALAVGGAQAQTVYKSTMPDGKIVYGEKPAPGAKKVDKIDPPPAKTGTTVITPEEKVRADQLAADRAKASAAAASKQTSADDARRQLKSAETARDTGKEPLPGERLGTAGGGSRLTDAYYERQKKLEQAVSDARKRLDDAQSGK